MEAAHKEKKEAEENIKEMAGKGEDITPKAREAKVEYLEKKTQEKKRKVISINLKS